MDDDLRRAVVAGLQHQDLPSLAILEKDTLNPRDYIESDRPVARKIMKRKESRSKQRSSSQSSSRAATPDPGAKRFNPRKDGLATLYHCLLRLYNSSSDGAISWNDIRSQYRKESNRHLNSEELNLICGTANRTKHDLLLTKLSCLMEPVDTKGLIVRIAHNEDGQPVALPSPIASDDDASSVGQSLSRLASMDDEEQQKILMEEKRRELTESLIRRGLLNPDGSRASSSPEKSDSHDSDSFVDVEKLDEEEDNKDLPELVADDESADPLEEVKEKERKESSDPELFEVTHENGLDTLVEEGTGEVMKDDVPAGVSPSDGKEQSLESTIPVVAVLDAPERKVSMVSVPSIEITQYSDDEPEEEEEICASDSQVNEEEAQLVEELVAVALSESIEALKTIEEYKTDFAEPTDSDMDDLAELMTKEEGEEGEKSQPEEIKEADKEVGNEEEAQDQSFAKSPTPAEVEVDSPPEETELVISVGVAEDKSEDPPVAAPRTTVYFDETVVLPPGEMLTVVISPEEQSDEVGIVTQTSLASVVTVEEVVQLDKNVSTASTSDVPAEIKDNVTATVTELPPVEKTAEFVPHTVTKTVTFEVLEQTQAKVVTLVTQVSASSEADIVPVQTQSVEPDSAAPRPVGRRVTLEVELQKLNEVEAPCSPSNAPTKEYEELMDMLEEKPHTAVSQELTTTKTNKVADIVVTLTPSQDLEKREISALPVEQPPKKKKEKKRRGLFGCCSFF